MTDHIRHITPDSQKLICLCIGIQTSKHVDKFTFERLSDLVRPCHCIYAMLRNWYVPYICIYQSYKHISCGVEYVALKWNLHLTSLGSDLRSPSQPNSNRQLTTGTRWALLAKTKCVIWFVVIWLQTYIYCIKVSSQTPNCVPSHTNKHTHLQKHIVSQLVWKIWKIMFCPNATMTTVTKITVVFSPLCGHTFLHVSINQI